MSFATETPRSDCGDQLVLIEETNPSITLCGELHDAIDGDRHYYWSSLPLESRSDKVFSHQCLTRSENDILDLVNGTGFDVEHVIISKIKYTSDSGEDVSGPKVTLISPTREVKSIISRIWCEMFIDLFAMFGRPPFDPPLRVGAVMQQGRGANRYYQLKLLG
jgi:hypothetical protein